MMADTEENESLEIEDEEEDDGEEEKYNIEYIEVNMDHCIEGQGLSFVLILLLLLKGF